MGGCRAETWGSSLKWGEAGGTEAVEVQVAAEAVAPTWGQD